MVFYVCLHFRSGIAMHKNVINNKNDNGKHYPNLVSVMQACMTPPSGITKFIAQNPFEADLTSRLHLSVISPTIFSTKKVKQNNNNYFIYSFIYNLIYDSYIILNIYVWSYL